jgi:hypothetical protein
LQNGCYTFGAFAKGSSESAHKLPTYRMPVNLRHGIKAHYRHRPFWAVRFVKQPAPGGKLTGFA